MPIDVVQLEDHLSECVSALQSGQLVAFPTETVYGLGCDARNHDACGKVFDLKGRPRTDPLIVHVGSFQHACEIWGLQESLSNDELIAKTCIEKITDTFWPGPLTVIYTAGQDYRESPVTAGTGLVGVRNPSHPIARRLIESSGIPIAAPSANRFGHTSPTAAQHVVDDFQEKLRNQHETLLVVDTPDKTPCDVGIESTIIRIRVDLDESCVYIDILRRGILTENDFRQLFQSDANGECSLHVNGTNVRVVIETVSKHIKSTDSAQTGPGQLIKHYAPNIPTYMVQLPIFLFEKNHEIISGCLFRHSGQMVLSLDVASQGGEKTASGDSHEVVPETELKSMACIDFAGYFACLKHLLHSYRDLSPAGDPREAARNIYSYMREVEATPGVEVLLVPWLGENSRNTELEASIADRLNRSASGVVLETVCRFV